MAMKQVIIVRQDLKLSRGKLAVQVAHASVDCVLKSSRAKTEEWHSDGMKKVVLKVNTLEDLHDLLRAASAARLVTALITDAGLTELPAGTTTCLGIGPDDDEKIDVVSGKLKLLG